MTTRHPQSGYGHIEVHSFCNSSSISSSSSAYPLGIISPPSSPSHKSALAFMLSYGGGLVAGDRVHLTVTLHPKARLALLTQGSTKVYKTPSGHSMQSLTVQIGDDAALLLLPDPLQPFKDSAYVQRQTFNVSNEASLLVLDWISAGRVARGEKWVFRECTMRNEVWAATGDGSEKRKKKLLLRDSLILRNEPEPFDMQDMDGFDVFGTLIIRGPVFYSVGAFFCEKFVRLPRLGQKADGLDLDLNLDMDMGVQWTAASLRGSVVVKFGAGSVDAARRWLRIMLDREGTVEREFGRKVLLCLQ